MIPASLDEAVSEVLKIVENNEYLLELIKEYELGFIGKTHHTLGRDLRNNWGLWSNSSLAKDITKLYDVTHGDDLSGIILHSAWRRFHDKSEDVSDIAESYKEHWSLYD